MDYFTSLSVILVNMSTILYLEMSEAPGGSVNEAPRFSRKNKYISAHSEYVRQYIIIRGILVLSVFSLLTNGPIDNSSDR